MTDIKQVRKNLSREKKIEALGNHSKQNAEFVQKQHAITEKNVLVITKECPGQKRFLSAYYDLLAVSLGYEEKGAGLVLEYLQANVKDGNVVIVTLKQLAEEAGASITWIKRTFDRLALDGYISKEASGIYRVTDEFLSLTRKPDQQTQIVFDFVQVADQLETVDDVGKIKEEMADDVFNLDQISKVIQK